MHEDITRAIEHAGTTWVSIEYNLDGSMLVDIADMEADMVNAIALELHELGYPCEVKERDQVLVHPK